MKQDRYIEELVSSPRYKINPNGFVLSYDFRFRNPEKAIWKDRSQTIGSSGRRLVRFRSQDRTDTGLDLARIIWRKFKGDFPNAPIMFKDGDPLNCHLDNLAVLEKVDVSQDGSSLDALIYRFLEIPFYEVDEEGGIWSTYHRTKKRIDHSNDEGYLKVAFAGKSLKAHRIIYAKFNGPLDPSLVIDHIDDNKLNNHPSNLRLVRQRVNANKYAKRYVHPERKRFIKPHIIKLIDEICADDRYDVRSDGTIWTLRVMGGALGPKWNQTGKCFIRGYPILRYKSTNLYVHQIVYVKFNGPLESDKIIRHRDNNPANSRPENLVQGSDVENAWDRPSNKLSMEIAQEIRHQYFELGQPQKKIAEKFGISRELVKNVILNRIYRVEEF